MSMGKRKRDRQPAMWVTATNLPTAASHPFYRRLNQLLRDHGFAAFVEAQCAGFYAANARPQKSGPSTAFTARFTSAPILAGGGLPKRPSWRQLARTARTSSILLNALFFWRYFALHVGFDRDYRGREHTPVRPLSPVEVRALTA